MEGKIVDTIIEHFKPVIYILGVVTAWALILAGKHFIDPLLALVGKGTRVHKRRDDEMMKRFMEAFEKFANAQAEIASALRDNGHLLEKVADTFLDFSREMRKSLTQINERLDRIERRGPHRHE
jgi:hypothetical protein